MGSIARVLAVGALVPWFAVSGGLPPEHVHESDAAGHHAAVTHRHAALHDHDGAEIEHGDGLVVWIHEIGITENTHSFPVLLFVVSTHIAIVPEPLARAAVAADEATLPHGPPRISPSLRAPPSVFL